MISKLCLKWLQQFHPPEQVGAQLILCNSIMIFFSHLKVYNTFEIMLQQNTNCRKSLIKMWRFPVQSFMMMKWIRGKIQNFEAKWTKRMFACRTFEICTTGNVQLPPIKCQNRGKKLSLLRGFFLMYTAFCNYSGNGQIKKTLRKFCRLFC